MDLLRPIAYLERNDFTENGDLAGPAGNKPVFIMIQGSYCGACTSAKPVFQQLANDGLVTCMTIQVDGDREGEKALQPILDKIYPNLTTIPNYVLYLDRSRKIPYKGLSNDLNGMKQFIKGLM
jgi:thiol-disulfide isomerase/thioredoxin